MANALNTQGDLLVPHMVPQEHFDSHLVTMVAAGGHHTAAVTDSGAVFAWGMGNRGVPAIPFSLFDV